MTSIQRPILAFHGESLQKLRQRTARWLMRGAFGRGNRDASVDLLPTIGIHRILVCHLSHTLGNTLLLTPLLRELQQTYPGAEVDVVTRSPVAKEIFGSFSCVRRIHGLSPHRLAAPWRLVGALRALRAHHYDLAIDPCLRSQSDRIGVLAAKATWKLGYIAPGKSGALSHGIAAPSDVRHVGQLPVHLLRRATGHSIGACYPPLDICLTREERAQGSALLARLVDADVAVLPPLIGVFANATGAKYLGAEWWQRFTERLAKRHPDHRIIEIVPVGGASLLGDRYPTAYSSDLRRLAGALSGLSLFVSADCGVMHLACASGAPTVGLFAVTEATQWGPYGPRDAVVEIAGLTPEQVAEALPLQRATACVDPATVGTPIPQQPPSRIPDPVFR